MNASNVHVNTEMPLGLSFLFPFALSKMYENHWLGDGKVPKNGQYTDTCEYVHNVVQ